MSSVQDDHYIALADPTRPSKEPSMTAAAPSAPSDHFTIISSDSHAGASHATYREYLDPAYLEDFDAWRNKYKNPYKDLAPGDDRRKRNWDDEMRNSQQETDGVVGEVVFPNTVPPFFPSFVLFAPPPPPDDYEHRLAGIRAHNRWLKDWCDEFPERRAGVGQIFLNDIDDAIADATWIKENGLRGGILLPAIPPDVKWVKPLYDPEYDRLWKVVEDLEIPVNAHGGTGVPDYGKYPTSMLLYIMEASFYSQRPFVQLTLSGVFDRFSRLKFVMTENGCAWLPGLIAHMDAMLTSIRGGGAVGEIRYTEDERKGQLLASEAFAQNCWMGVSQPGMADAKAMTFVGEDRFMWGSDYPHDEGTYPHSREAIRSRFHELAPDVKHKILAANAAALYDFDLDALEPLAERVGPTVAELAEPLRELPENPSQGLARGYAASDRADKVLSDDMDSTAL
jgi:predicted TIM-barrel fold metal-dependent hydrolase